MDPKLKFIYLYLLKDKSLDHRYALPKVKRTVRRLLGTLHRHRKSLTTDQYETYKFLDRYINGISANTIYKRQGLIRP